MPKLTNGADIEAALAEWTAFEDPVAWRRSGRGNLTRIWEGCRVTIFPRGDGYYWCVADDDGTRFSPQGYRTERVAMEEAGTAVGVAYWFVPERR